MSDEKELKSDGDFLQQVIDTVGDPVFVKNEKHEWIFLNDAFCRLMGRERQELLGKSDYDFFPKEEADVFWEKDNQVFSTGEPDENEENFTDSEGREHIIITKKSLFTDGRGQKILVGVIRDITERRRLEARLSVAKRLMSLGTLAGGVAHEINNPLSFVMGNLEFAIETLDDPDGADEKLRDALSAALRGAERVQRIVAGLRTFSRSSDEGLSPIDLRESLRAAVHLARNEILHRAELVEDYGQVPIIHGDPRSLDQIFLNLLINATQSLTDDGENQIRVATRTDSQGRAIVEISDTGEGISEEIRSHIFDPFFTTKTVGEGTGLGLAICHTLVEAMNGEIEVESDRGKGSTFRLMFPPLPASDSRSATTS